MFSVKWYNSYKVCCFSGHDGIINPPDISDTYDRPASAIQQALMLDLDHMMKQGRGFPKMEVYAAAGVGKARAEYSVFEAEAKGPNASAGAEISGVGVGAMARAEIASASAKAGPLGVKVGLGFDTGCICWSGWRGGQFLGTGFSVGKKNSISVLGNEASCSVM